MPVSPETGAGELVLLWLPIPSWPSVLQPQAKSAPSVRKARECALPAQTFVIPVKNGMTSVYLNTDLLENVRIEIIGQNGQIVRTKSLTNLLSGEVTLPLDGLNKGIYVVKITGDKITESVKIIIQ